MTYNHNTYEQFNDQLRDINNNTLVPDKSTFFIQYCEDVLTVVSGDIVMLTNNVMIDG